MNFVDGLKLALQRKDESKDKSVVDLVRSGWQLGEHVVLEGLPQEGLLVIDADGEPRMLEQEDVLAIDWVVRQRGLALGKPFEWALTQMKAGKRVCRKGWDGMALALVEAEEWSSSIGFGRTAENAYRRPWIAMKTADGGLGPWLGSQSDLLSNDWEEAK
jgi:Protein of unknown function (DUF2829)